MSNENKTALTAEEILDKWDVEYISESLREYYSDNVVGAMQEFASLQTQSYKEQLEEKDKEIERLREGMEKLKLKNV